MDTVADAEWSRMTRTGLTLDVGMRPADPAPDVVLASPDVRLLKLTSPELERLVLQQYNHDDQQQHQRQQSSKDGQLTLDASATGEYTRDFVDALLELHAQRQTYCDTGVSESTPKTSASSFQSFSARSSIVYGTPHQPGPDFCHARPSSSDSNHVTSSNTPTDLPQQCDDERARLELKRARNRLAATRCRNRKLERIEQLQNRADRLRAANAKLVDEVKRLRETVNQLRQDVLLHGDCQLSVTMPTTTSLFDSNVRYGFSEAKR